MLPLPTKDDFITRGYPEHLAESLMKMTPIELVACLPIVGNHWSDSPLFAVIRRVLTDPEMPFQVKRAALAKQYLATGDFPGFTDAEAEAKIAEYLKYA